MTHARLIPVNQTAVWLDALAQCGPYDTYHLPAYHALAAGQGEGEPHLFFFEDQGRCAALPFLLRPLAAVEGLEGSRHRDAASAYGYPGLLASVNRNDATADAFRAGFQAALREAMADLNVVSFFGRQNPLIDTAWLFLPMAETTRPGPTVAVDLALPEEEQVDSMRRDHRYDVRRARKTGMLVKEDFHSLHVDTFRRLYEETMDRAGAAKYYYFSPEYFTKINELLRGNVKLLFSEQGGNVISGAMFLLTGNIIQYHLSGTATRSLKCRGGMKVLLDEVRVWGSRNGFRWLHLGGGLGAHEDSLFQFKAGFSTTRFQFETARLVLQPKLYHELTRKRQRWIDSENRTAPPDRFFPAYRHPGKRRAA